MSCINPSQKVHLPPFQTRPTSPPLILHSKPTSSHPYTTHPHIHRPFVSTEALRGDIFTIKPQQKLPTKFLFSYKAVVGPQIWNYSLNVPKHDWVAVKVGRKRLIIIPMEFYFQIVPQIHPWSAKWPPISFPIVMESQWAGHSPFHIQMMTGRDCTCMAISFSLRK